MRVSGPSRGRRARKQIPVLVLAVCLSATALVSYVMQRVVDSRARSRFESEVLSVASHIDIELDTYAALVRGTAAFMMTGQQDRAPAEQLRRLRAYARGLELDRYYVAAGGIGYLRRLDTTAQGDVFLAAAMGEHPAMQLWPRPTGDERHAVVMFEPLTDELAGVLGFDAGTDPPRRAAMKRARDEGAPAISGRVALIADTSKRPGFVLYMPVYTTPEPPVTVEQRREALHGFVFVPFRAPEFFRALLDALGVPAVAFRVQDGADPGAGSELWSSHDARTFASAHFHTRRMLRVAGHTWTLSFASVPALQAADSGQPLVPIFLLGGVAVAVLLAGVSSAQVRARSLAEAMMAERSMLLEREKEARAEAQTLHQIGRRLSAELDLDKLVQGIVDAGTELVGAAYGALRYRDGDHVEIAVAGLPRELVLALPTMQASPSLAPGLRPGERVLRVDDVFNEPRFAHNVPAGHPEVRSFLAAAVLSRSGECLGGLFFGHPAPGRFQDRHERLVTGLAAQAAIAVDNARLFRQSQEALRTRDEFFSVASHELKTPLTSLRLQVEGTLHQLGKGEPMHHDKLTGRLDQAVRQIARIAALIDRMLDISRISDGKIEVELEQVDLVELLRELVQRFEHEAERCGSKITFVAPVSVVGTWDRLRLDQVVTNLISNALKYGRGRPVEIEVGGDDHAASFVIRDHGIGIASADQTRLFGQFERMVSSRNFSGFGLGLWISRQIIEEMGGTISVKSELGTGSTFVVTLPLRRLGVRAAEPEARRPAFARR